MELVRPIVTTRLILRGLSREAGFGRYAQWMADQDVIRYLEARLRPSGPDDLAAYIERMNGSEDNLFLGIFLGGTDQHIGNIKLGPINGHHRRAHVGVMIGAKEHWGKGLAAEAIDALCRHAFGELGLHRVDAGCNEFNESSKKAFAKAGFTEEAVMRDYWLCEGEWHDQVMMARIAAP